MELRIISWFFLMVLFASCTTEKVQEQKNPIDFGKQARVSIIPQPQELQLDSGYFEFNSETVIYTDPFCKNEAEYFQKALQGAGLNLPVKVLGEREPPPNHPNRVVFLSGANSVIGKSGEFYDLHIGTADIELVGRTSTGLFRGIQSILQLFVIEFFQNKKAEKWYVQSLEIADNPAFSHRGMLLDCSRHFFDKEVVKKYIDLLAFYKMNVLHWHLTEDQGWRIAIDNYPKLTEIGAWRTEIDGSRYGGYYTKAEIREIVSYAAARHIEVIPEIEMPGHSQAALAAYPQYSCIGDSIEVANQWGVFKELYCAGNDETFQFLETVLKEVMDLFPSKYIHIGGDEAPKYRWENCAKCQKRIKDEGLKDEHELQRYFIQRISEVLKANGRKLIGWDDILEGGLADDAIIQSWQGLKGGIEAVTSGHYAIMSPTSHAYFDYPLNNIDLEKVYQFDPIPGGLTSEQESLILGGECNLWSEHIPNEAKLDEQTFPRFLAMSEVLWSYPRFRKMENFLPRVRDHYPILQAKNVAFGAETMPVAHSTEVRFGIVNLVLQPKQEGIDIFWSEMDSIPSNPYKEPISIKSGGVRPFYIQAKRDVYDMGQPLKLLLSNHRAVGSTVTLKYPFNEAYTAGGTTGLVDGLLGSKNFRDGHWQGFWGNDLEAVVNLGKDQLISKISLNALQYRNAWILLPIWMEFWVSEDAKNYKSVGKVEAPYPPQKYGEFLGNYSVNFESQEVRYIKVVAKNYDKLPDWHNSAGAEAWIFVDEIIAE